MKRRPLLLLLGLLGCGRHADAPTGEAPPADVYSNDTSDNQGFVPNPDFVPQVPAYAIKRSKLSLEGEVLVVEGDAQTVSTGGPNVFGISQDNQVAIVQRVLSEYPDVFDTIQIYTTFIDEAHAGTAYYQSIRNSVAGIGVNSFNGRAGWGLPPTGGRLSGFSNMNSMLMWGGGSFDGLNRIAGSYHAVIAQELSHRWLFRMKFDLGDGNGDHDDLIGRDDAHWSRLAHSEGSVQDGQSWEKIGDRLFENRGTDLGFAPLDLYAMGFIAADEVPEFFYLTDAVFNGDMLTKTSRVPLGARVSADDNPVTIEDVIRAMGPRNPPVDTEDPYYRAAFVLVTAPGEPRNSWVPHLRQLQDVARDFPESWRMWTRGSSAICTKVSERCPEPVIGLAGHVIEDGNDGLLAPGEDFELGLSIINHGVGTTRNVMVELEPVGAGATLSGGPITVPEVGEGQTVALPERFSVTVSSTIACGDTIAFSARFITEEGPIFRGLLTLGVGTKRLRIDPLDEAPDWTVDPDGDDTAFLGQWALGEPEFASALGVVTQPREDHTPGESKLSFHTGPSLMSSFSANDVDGGFTTLQSPPFALRDTRDPKLVFYYWRVAANFAVRPMEMLGGDTALVVQASDDGGASWTELGRFEEQTDEWTRAELRIRDAVDLTNRVMFRFVVADDTMNGTVEAGIDDVEVVDFLDECEIEMPMMMDAGVTRPPTGGDDREGGGCTAAGSASPLALVLLGLFFLRRRR